MKFPCSARQIFFRLLAPASLLLLATPLVVAAAPANPPLTELVDDQTAFAVIVTDAPALVKGWDASPFAHTWNDEQVVKFFGPLRQQLKIDTWDDQAKAATGKTVRELLALAKGGAIVSVPSSFVTDMLAGKPPVAPPGLFAVEFGDNAATVEKLAADAAAKNTNLRVETTNYAGVLVHTSTQPAPKDSTRPAATDVNAMCQGIWLSSPSYERVCAAIDAIKKGGLPNALGRSENFLRAKKRAGDAQLIGYYDLHAMYPAMLAGAQKALPPPGTEGGPPFTAESLLKGLGLDALGEAFFTVNFDPKETRLTYGLGWSEERGLVKLLAFGPGAAMRPEWVPAKWVSASSAKFDFRAAYAAVEEMVAAISPQGAAMMDGEIKNAGAQLGIDIKRDLIGSLGSDTITAAALPAEANPDQPPALDQLDQLISVSLENPEAFTKAIEAVKRTALADASDQLFTKRDYLGSTLYTFTPPTQPGAPAERGFTYAIVNRTLLVGIGSASTVEAALQGMNEKRPSFWGKPEVKSALAGLPDNASGIGVQDTRIIMAGLFGMISSLPLPPTIVDASAKPDFARLGRYWGLRSDSMVKDAKGLFGVSRIANPTP